jgi:hypothetical protein
MAGSEVNEKKSVLPQNFYNQKIVSLLKKKTSRKFIVYGLWFIVALAVVDILHV